MPVVSVDRSLVGAAIDKVEVDNRRGAFEAVDLLVRKGHRRIGLIAGQANISTNRLRRLGYNDALSSHAIQVREEYVRVGDQRQASGRALAHELLSLGKPPTALFVVNNLMAVGALEAMHQRRLAVPGDVALIGFDDLPWAEALSPPLTVVRQPAYEVGRNAAELLLKRLSDPQRPETHLKLMPELIVRSSC